jgi:hypothetical protein
LAAVAPALRCLTALNLQGCSTLTDAGLTKMGCLTALASLNLSECPGITGAGIAGWDLPALTSLQLQNSPAVDDAGVASVAGLTGLRSLNLKQCKRVGDAGLAAIAPKLQHLTSLCLQASATAGTSASAAVPAFSCCPSIVAPGLPFH